MKKVAQQASGVNTPCGKSSGAAKRRWRKFTITLAAEMFGVTRQHLSLVVNGHRTSSKLLARFLEAKSQHAFTA